MARRATSLNQTVFGWVLSFAFAPSTFVERHRQDKRPEQLRELFLAHRRSLVLPLSEYPKRYADRDEAMYKAYQSGAYSMAEIAKHFSVHYMTVSRAVRKWVLGFE